MKEFIEIPFGAKDSELGGWEYTIPKGYTANIENGKIIVKKEESEDERMRNVAINACKYMIDNFENSTKQYEDAIAWLEKQSAKISVYSNTLFKIATILSQYEDKDDSPLEKIRSIMIDGTICSMDLESKNKKQGEQNPYSGVSFKYNGHTWGMCARDNGVDILLDKQLFKHLEKQGEQKLTDEEMKILLQTEYEKGKADAIEQKSAWSEEDENKVTIFMQLTEGCDNEEELANWLKALKERYTWKPSKEQMYYLSWIANVKLGSGVVEQEVSKHLNELYDDLKKLREE